MSQRDLPAGVGVDDAGDLEGERFVDDDDRVIGDDDDDAGDSVDATSEQSFPASDPPPAQGGTT